MTVRRGRLVLLGGAVSISAPIVVAIATWSQNRVGFWDLKFVDVLSPAVALLIGVVLAGMLTEQSERRSRREQLLDGLLCEALERSGAVFRDILEYTKSPSQERQDRIIEGFGELGRQISFWRNAGGNETSACATTLEKAFLRLKRAATDTPFGQQNPAQGSEIQRRVDDAHPRFVRAVLAARLAHCAVD